MTSITKDEVYFKCITSLICGRPERKPNMMLIAYQDPGVMELWNLPAEQEDNMKTTTLAETRSHYCAS